jgi:hypothetical protein
MCRASSSGRTVAADAAALPGQVLFQFGRVGPDGKVAGTSRVGGAEPDAGVQRHRTLEIGDQWIDVQLGNLRHFGQQLRHRHQCLVHGRLVHRWCVAPTSQQA